MYVYCKYLANLINKTGNIRTYNVTSWQLRLHFTPLGLLRQSADIISYLWKFHVTGNHKTYLGFHAKLPIFLLDFSNIWIFLTDYPKSPQYQISRTVRARAETN
jgi:hypothetical protein